MKLFGEPVRRADLAVARQLTVTLSGNFMMKLYIRLGGHLYYHEAWASEHVVFEHWGAVGSYGVSKEHDFDRGLSEEENVLRILNPAKEDGFSEVDVEDHQVMVIEYTVVGFGTDKDIDKRNRLMEYMHQILSWGGLGHCDGASAGSDTMEVSCYVVDYELALTYVKEQLAETEFKDYSRIYCESDA